MFRLNREAWDPVHRRLNGSGSVLSLYILFSFTVSNFRLSSSLIFIYIFTSILSLLCTVSELNANHTTRFEGHGSSSEPVLQLLVHKSIPLALQKFLSRPQMVCFCHGRWICKCSIPIFPPIQLAWRSNKSSTHNLFGFSLSFWILDFFQLFD